MSDYERTTTTSAGNTKTVPRSELSAKSNRSTSSGRGSVEEDEDADVEIRMINEGNWNMQTSVQSTTGKFPKNNPQCFHKFFGQNLELNYFVKMLY